MFESQFVSLVDSFWPPSLFYPSATCKLVRRLVPLSFIALSCLLCSSCCSLQILLLGCGSIQNSSSLITPWRGPSIHPSGAEDGIAAPRMTSRAACPRQCQTCTSHAHPFHADVAASFPRWRVSPRRVRSTQWLFRVRRRPSAQRKPQLRPGRAAHPKAASLRACRRVRVTICGWTN